MDSLLEQQISKRLREGEEIFVSELHGLLQSCRLSDVDNISIAALKDLVGKEYQEDKKIKNVADFLQHWVFSSQIAKKLLPSEKQKKTGVSIRMFFVNENEFSELGEAVQSNVGDKNPHHTKTSPSKVKKNNNQVVNAGHAEHKFLQEFSTQVVEDLIEKSVQMKNESVEHIGTAVKFGLPFIGPHILVYTSSSPCSDCQLDFKKMLYDQLKNNKVDIPIVFFALQPTNTMDAKYGIWTFYEGECRSIGLKWHGKIQSKQEIEKQYNEDLKELSDYGSAVAALYQSTTSIKYAPDVIFMKHLCHNNGSAVKKLRKFYESVNLELLETWRSTIKEFLALVNVSKNKYANTEYYKIFGQGNGVSSSVLLESLKALTKSPKNKPAINFRDKLVKATEYFDKNEQKNSDCTYDSLVFQIQNRNHR